MSIIRNFDILKFIFIRYYYNYFVDKVFMKNLNITGIALILVEIDYTNWTKVIQQAL